jgi:hypothetical protein
MDIDSRNKSSPGSMITVSAVLTCLSIYLFIRAHFMAEHHLIERTTWKGGYAPVEPWQLLCIGLFTLLLAILAFISAVRRRRRLDDHMPRT